jgi:hypothetical protein
MGHGASSIPRSDTGSLHALGCNGSQGLCHRTHKEVSFYVFVLFHVCFLSLLTFVYKRENGLEHKEAPLYECDRTTCGDLIFWGDPIYWGIEVRLLSIILFLFSSTILFLFLSNFLFLFEVSFYFCF